MTAIETTTLRNGMKVLAKIDKKFGLCAMTFVNNRQAETKNILLIAQGYDSYVYQPSLGVVRYIVVK